MTLSATGGAVRVSSGRLLELSLSAGGVSSPEFEAVEFGLESLFKNNFSSLFTGTGESVGGLAAGRPAVQPGGISSSLPALAVR